MLKPILEVLIFLKLVDRHDKSISLTNLIIMGSIFAIFKADTVSFAEISGLLVSVIASTAKKIVNKNKTDNAEKVIEQVKAIVEESQANINTQIEASKEESQKLQNQINALSLNRMR